MWPLLGVVWSIPLADPAAASQWLAQAPQVQSAEDLADLENGDSEDLQLSDSDDTLQVNLATRSLQLRSDQQSFNQRAQVFEAEGNVEMVFGRTRLLADRMRIELQEQRVVAEGNVQVQLDQQRVQGERLEYNFTEEQGTLEPAFGEVDIGNLPTDDDHPTLSSSPLTRTSGEDPSRLLRFQAARIEFDATEWRGIDVRITNDPYNPPELEYRSPQVTTLLRADGSSVITADQGQLVFDQAFFLPLPIQVRLDQLNQQPPISVYFDNFDREEIRRGLVIQPNFELLETPNVSFVLSPQVYPQRLFDELGGLENGLGLRTDLNVKYPNTGQVTHVMAELRGVVFEELSDRLLLEVEHLIPTGRWGRVTYSYGFRERFFSGLLGFQIVQNRLGTRYASPTQTLGNSGIAFNYQLALDLIDALGQDPINTDVALGEQTSDQQLQLARLQVGTTLSRSFILWQPSPPPTPGSPPELHLKSETTVANLWESNRQPPPSLRFSPVPIEEGLWLNTGLSSSQSYYTNGEAQSFFSGSIGIDAVVGRFVKDTLDYTNVSVTYTNGFLSGASPFLFDRITTREQLDLGILQQIYGPIRVGAETTVDLQSGQAVDTTYTLGYDRRTYGLRININPERETGALELRVDSFNWNNVANPITELNRGIEQKDEL
ncbi:MAG: DUF3769 domain-containing protein [Synechococcaceae cyanobacterium SM2_3_1]|nr:DUF3769 domain-containing protein [Synechococcaceae cyanobacterium SM2_3_1]